MVKRISHAEAWEGLADCRSCAIRKSVLFSGLEESDFDIIPAVDLTDAAKKVVEAAK